MAERYMEQRRLVFWDEASHSQTQSGLFAFMVPIMTRQEVALRAKIQLACGARFTLQPATPKGVIDTIQDVRSLDDLMKSRHSSL